MGPVFKQAHRKFDAKAFISDSLNAYVSLNLRQRGSHMPA